MIEKNLNTYIKNDDFVARDDETSSCYYKSKSRSNSACRKKFKDWQHRTSEFFRKDYNSNRQDQKYGHYNKQDSSKRQFVRPQSVNIVKRKESNKICEIDKIDKINSLRNRFSMLANNVELVRTEDSCGNSQPQKYIDFATEPGNSEYNI